MADQPRIVDVGVVADALSDRAAGDFGLELIGPGNDGGSVVAERREDADHGAGEVVTMSATGVGHGGHAEYPSHGVSAAAVAL